MIAKGFEPLTVCLEGRCSIQLSYATLLKNVGVAGFEPATSASQTRRDNRATLHPEMAERQGFEPWRRLHVDRLAICSITTLAPLQYYKVFNKMRLQK